MRGELIHHPGCDQHLATLYGIAFEFHREAGETTSRLLDLSLPQGNIGIVGELGPCVLLEFVGRDAVPGEKAVHRPGRPAAGRAPIAKQDCAPASTENQRRTETCGPGACYDHVPVIAHYRRPFTCSTCCAFRWGEVLGDLLSSSSEPD